MKRIILLFISGLIAFHFTACGVTDFVVSSNNSTVGSQENISGSSDDNQENGENADGENQEDGGESTIFVVTFDATGGTPVQSQSIAKGGRVEKPTAPTKTEDSKYEYAFAGWYWGDCKWNFETDPVTENITLTAKWDVKSIYTEPFLPSD